MLRLALLTSVAVALVPLGPLGCPPTDDLLDDSVPLPRGNLPTTAAADPQSATAGQTVTLTASSEGETVYYAWIQTGGPGVPISNADQAAATFTAPSLKTEQTLRFRVTAYNGADVGWAEVSVTVAADPNYGKGSQGTQRLVADAGSDQTALPGTQVVLDGSRSMGVSLVYQWRQLSGTAVTLSDAETARARFTAPAYSAGGTNVLLFELTVTDANGRSQTDRTQVKIKDPNAKSPQVKFETTMGDFTVELNEDKAPVTVSNFLRYVDQGFYDGTIIHRVVKDFVIQGGGYLPGLKEKETGAPIINEANNGLTNARGTIGMARAQDPNSATSQFYINLVDNNSDDPNKTNLDPNGITKEGYCVFGRVIAGMDVIDQMAQVETRMDEPGKEYVPKVDIVVRHASRIGQASSSGTAGSSGPPSHPVETKDTDKTGTAGGSGGGGTSQDGADASKDTS